MPGGPAYDNCTEVTDFCTVDQTVYGYRPNLGINVFLVIVFAAGLILTLLQAFRYKSFWYNWWIAVGAGGEMAGFVGRIIMHNNPWDENGFMCQIASLIFSPSFFAAAIYLTLKHMVRAVGTEYSPIPANLYTWIFIICDFISLLLQAAGGGVAAGADDDKTSDAGGKIMLAGIIFQVVTFTILYALVAWVVLRMYRARRSIKPSVATMLRSRDFRLFAGSIFVASLAIYIRCIYRIAELAGGWGNHIMRDEPSYVVLDNIMVAIALVCLIVAHPGRWFKCMLNKEYPSLMEDSSMTKMGSMDGSNPAIHGTPAAAAHHDNHLTGSGEKHTPMQTA